MCSGGTSTARKAEIRRARDGEVIVRASVELFELQVVPGGLEQFPAGALRQQARQRGRAVRHWTTFGWPRPS